MVTVSSGPKAPGRVLVVVLATIMLFAVLLPGMFNVPSPVFAQGIDTQYCTTTGSYSVCTDQTDYFPTSIVHIAGFGFAPGSSYSIKVTRPDGSSVTGNGSFVPWPTPYDTVTANATGNFEFDYVLDGILGNYTIEVLDSENNVVATHSFTDSISVHTVAPSDSTGATKTSFLVTNSVYAHITTTGTGTTYVDLYVVTSLPLHKEVISYVVETTGVQVTGDITPLVWGATTNAGTYYIVVDENQDGKYENSEHVSSSFAITSSDTTPPVITKVITGTSGANSWYTSNVIVAWTVTDPESSVVIDAGCGTQTFTTDTASAVSSCSAYSAGGSSSDSVNFKIDKTGPTASLSVTAGTAGTNGWYTSDVTIHASGADSISSPVTCTADQSLTTETTGTVFHGSCTNDAGLSTAAADLTVKLDKTAPLITVTGTNPITIEVYSSYTDAGATVTDNLDPSVTVVSSGSVNSDLVGDYTIYYDAVDAAGNHAVQKSRTVHVTPRPITVTADSQTEVYGESDPGLTYKITSGSLHDGDLFTGALTRDAGEDVGTYAITQGTLALNSNYDLTFVGADLTITKANAVISVSGYTGVYDGNAHGTSGTATGVKGEDLSSSLDLGSTFTNVPGDTAHWTFTGGTNYNDASGDVAIAISKADAAIVVTPYSVTYDGDPHTATGTATGVKSESLSGLDLSGTTHTNAGDYPADAWAFTDVTGNYNDASGTVHDSISKAAATLNVVGYTGVYDGDAHGATGTATGVKSEDLSSSLDLGSSFTNVPGGTAHWTFTGGTNYKDVNGDAAIVITKADAAITVTPYSATYDGNAHTATGSATGVLGESLSGLVLSGTTHTNAGDYPTDAWTFTGGTNYNDASGTVSDKISKADATIVVTPYDVPYDGNAHTATGSAKGVKGESLSGLDLSGTTHTNAGTYTGDAWTFTDVTGNYNGAGETVDDKISKKALTVTANSDSKTFGETYTFAGTEFTTLGLVNPPDTVTSVTLASDGAAATATVGSYDIVGSDAVGTGLSNYDITYNKGTLTVDQRPTTTTITAASVQYSDPITLTATVSPITSGDQKLTGSVEFFISDVSVGSQSIDESGVAKLSGILNSRAAGSYDVRAVFASKNSNFAGSEGTGTLSVTKESTKIEYTGDTSVFTAGPTINKAPIRLSAKLTQEDDHYPGDLTLAKVTFELTSGAGGGSTIAVANIPVSATGDALTTTEQVPVGDYYVKVTISSGNSYWTQSEIGAGILDIVVGSNEQRVTGGGWIPDSKSANGKDNFGFTVNYNKNGAPKGNFLFMLRGADGYNYQVKSNSWAKGGLSFTSANTAYFTAKCTIQKIDRTTGIAESLGGDYTFVVNIKDGDLMNPKTLDTFTVTIFDSSNNIWKQVGTASSQITLGGGNIVVHSK